MTRFHLKSTRVRQVLLPIALAACSALFQSSTALAEKYSEMAAPVATKSYVYQYLLVGMCVALGVFLVGQPAKRTESVDKADSLSYTE